MLSLIPAAGSLSLPAGQYSLWKAIRRAPGLLPLSAARPARPAKPPPQRPLRTQETFPALHSAVLQRSPVPLALQPPGRAPHRGSTRAHAVRTLPSRARPLSPGRGREERALSAAGRPCVPPVRPRSPDKKRADLQKASRAHLGAALPGPRRRWPSGPPPARAPRSIVCRVPALGAGPAAGGVFCLGRRPGGSCELGSAPSASGYAARRPARPPHLCSQRPPAPPGRHARPRARAAPAPSPQRPLHAGAPAPRAALPPARRSQAPPRAATWRLLTPLVPRCTRARGGSGCARLCGSGAPASFQRGAGAGRHR